MPLPGLNLKCYVDCVLLQAVCLGHFNRTQQGTVRDGNNTASSTAREGGCPRLGRHAVYIDAAGGLGEKSSFFYYICLNSRKQTDGRPFAGQLFDGCQFSGSRLGKPVNRPVPSPIAHARDG